MNEISIIKKSKLKDEKNTNPNKVLHLPLKKEWYEMIESGVKTEEYIEIKPYWSKRFIKNFPVLWRTIYTHVKFSYGYTKRTMIFEIESITIGKGKPEWGAPTEDVFIIGLGERILEP